jgi:predicted HD phosphohydrolase
MNIIESAKQLAKLKHKDQLYGTNNPYFIHLEQVATMASKLGYCEEVIAACYLHDIVEDTDVSTDDLRKDYPKTVVDAVESVTYHGKDRKAKIDKAISNPVGHVVKFCDASCNYSNSVIYGPSLWTDCDYTVYINRRAGYVSRLLQTLPTPLDIDNYLKSI